MCFSDVLLLPIAAATTKAKSLLQSSTNLFFPQRLAVGHRAIIGVTGLVREALAREQMGVTRDLGESCSSLQETLGRASCNDLRLEVVYVSQMGAIGHFRIHDLGLGR